MSKKLVCLLLCILMLIPCAAVSSFAYENPFIDVPEGKWYTEAVLWGCQQGYFAGTSENTFSPNGDFTRAQLVTVLAKVDGVNKDDYSGPSVFTDVAEGKYYTEYVNWAQRNGVVTGAGDGTFAPGRAITRQEICVMIKAYLSYRKLTLKTVNEPVAFADAASISSWATSAVSMAQKCDLVTGDNAGSFDPKGTCQRKMAAQIVMKLVAALETATPANKGQVIAYYNVSASPSLEEYAYVDVLNYHPARVTSSSAPYISDPYSTVLSTVRAKAVEQNPDIKFVFTVANANLSTFEACLYPYDNLYAFGDALLSRVTTYGFDGIDIDYEFPTSNALKKNFVKLMEYLRTKLDELEAQNGREYILSMAVPAGSWAFDKFDIVSLANYVDYFNIMNYDLYSGADYNMYTHHHAPAYDNTLPGYAGGSVASDIQLYLSKGIPADKIVPGAGLYSREWTNVQSDGDGLFSLGVLGDSNIHYSVLLASYIGKEGTGINGFTRYWDDNSKAPYLYNPTSKIFLSYDDEESVSYKVDLIKDAGVRGIMVFDYCTCDGTGFLEKLYGMMSE